MWWLKDAWWWLDEHWPGVLLGALIIALVFSIVLGLDGASHGELVNQGACEVLGKATESDTSTVPVVIPNGSGGTTGIPIVSSDTDYILVVDYDGEMIEAEADVITFTLTEVGDTLVCQRRESRLFGFVRYVAVMEDD